MPVTVVTDTTQYLPRELLEEQGVQVVSLYVNEADGTRREGDMPDFDAFYERLRTAEQLPTTSQPNVGDFLAAYEPLLDAGHDVVSLHISGGISGTVESANQAAAEATKSHGARRVAVVDTRSACGGMGSAVLAAAAAARRPGATIDQVEAHAREAVGACRIWFAVDTLEYLKRGGRIGAAQAWFGGALRIKPILTLDGEITPIERVRTQSRAVERLVEFFSTMKEEGIDGWMVQHIQDPERAAAIVERGREVFGTEPVAVSEIGPVIGAHVGPGLLGVGGIPRRMLS